MARKGWGGEELDHWGVPIHPSSPVLPPDSSAGDEIAARAMVWYFSGAWWFVTVVLVPMLAAMLAWYVLGGPWWEVACFYALNGLSFSGFFYAKRWPGVANAIRVIASVLGPSGAVLGRYLFCNKNEAKRLALPLVIGLAITSYQENNLSFLYYHHSSQPRHELVDQHDRAKGGHSVRTTG